LVVVAVLVALDHLPQLQLLDFMELVERVIEFQLLV